MQTFYRLAADTILVTHVLIVLFNVASLPMIWVGHWCQWRFVRNFYFRAVHLVLLVVIAAQSALGQACPLTNWENTLRTKAGAGTPYEGGFIAHWLQRLIFYEGDEKVFTVAYIAFLVSVLITWIYVKPWPPRWWRKASP